MLLRLACSIMEETEKAFPNRADRILNGVD